MAFAGLKRHFARPEATGCKVLSVYCTATLFTDQPINKHRMLDIYYFQSQPQYFKTPFEFWKFKKWCGFTLNVSEVEFALVRFFSVADGFQFSSNLF